MTSDDDIIGGVEGAVLTRRMVEQYVDHAPSATVGEPLATTPSEIRAYNGALLIGFMLCLVGITEAVEGDAAEELDPEAVMERAQRVLRRLADRERRRREGRCPEHGMRDCSALLNGCTYFTAQQG